MPNHHSLFVDTSGWACLLNYADPIHHAMTATYQTAIAQKRTLVTTNLVLAELLPLLDSRARIQRAHVIRYVDTLRSSPFVTISHIDEQTDAEAWELLKQYADKEWSVVDAASFVIMRRMGSLDALTTDHHFSQAGFVRLPIAPTPG